MPKFTKDSFVQNLAHGQLVVPYLERYDQLDEEWSFTYKPKQHDDAWHPSGDILPPLATLYAKALGAEREPLSPGTQRNFMVGHFWHALVQRILCKLEFCTEEDVERSGQKEWAWETSDEVSTTPKPYHWARGSGDIAPLILPSGWRGVFDIKTMAGAMWKASWKSGLLPPAFADKYEAQINIYMDFFDEEKALILGVNKDAPHGFVEFEFERNQELIDTVYAKWEYVSYCLSNEVEPDPEADREFALPFTGPIS